MRRSDEQPRGGALVAGLSVALSALCGMLVGVGAWILVPSGAAPQPAAAAPSVPEPAASAAPAPSATPASSASPVDPVVCLTSMFPDDTFTAPMPDLALVCEEKQPVKGASRVKEIVVKAGSGRTTGGMKEWAVLGHFGVAAFASIRARCCVGSEPLEVPELPPSCSSMRTALEAVARASVPGGSEEDATLATEGFRKSLACALRGGPKGLFGDHPPPGGGEVTTFRKTLDRARESR